MKPINDALKILLLVVAIFALAELGLFFRDMRSAARETTATMAEAKATISELRDYSREQLARLRDPRGVGQAVEHPEAPSLADLLGQEKFLPPVGGDRFVGLDPPESGVPVA